jgi:hypothetical protein
MSRHGFHAANFGDVVKHSVYCLVLQSLIRKPKPIFVLDTHASLGLFDLHGKQAQRTLEFQVAFRMLLFRVQLAAQQPINQFSAPRLVLAGSWTSSTQLRISIRLCRLFLLLRSVNTTPALTQPPFRCIPDIPPAVHFAHFAAGLPPVPGMPGPLQPSQPQRPAPPSRPPSGARPR